MASPLHIVPIRVGDNHAGFGLTHPYVEHVWTSVIGPSGIAVLRRAGLLFEAFPRGLVVDFDEFAASMGIRQRTDTQSLLTRALARLDRFDLVTWKPDQHRIEIPTAVGPVPARLVRSLPASTVALHRSLSKGLTPTDERGPEPCPMPTPRDAIPHPAPGLFR